MKVEVFDYGDDEIELVRTRNLRDRRNHSASAGEWRRLPLMITTLEAAAGVLLDYVEAMRPKPKKIHLAVLTHHEPLISYQWKQSSVIYGVTFLPTETKAIQDWVVAALRNGYRPSLGRFKNATRYPDTIMEAYRKAGVVG